MPSNVSEIGKVHDIKPPTSYMTELSGFCRALAERSREDKSASFVRVWVEILENIIHDEEASRAEAAKIAENILVEGGDGLSSSARDKLSSLLHYLKNDTAQ